VGHNPVGNHKLLANIARYETGFAYIGFNCAMPRQFCFMHSPHEHPNFAALCAASHW
jgi:hypothetical protein